MTSNFFSILILSALLLFSCSNDDDNTVPPPLQHDCESVGLQKYTECCIEGPIQAKQDQIISFTYTSNFENALYEWEVFGNSMTIVEGQNAEIVKVKTSKNFVRDSIAGYSISPNGLNSCRQLIVIELY